MHCSNGFIVRGRYYAMALLTAGIWCGVLRTSTQAQSAEYVVIPVTRADDHFPEIVRLSEAVDAELEKRSLSHVRLATARGVFEARHSREPIPASKEDIDLLVAAANNALSAVTNADWKTALDQLNVAMARGERALESTNRNFKTAQHLFHACLLAVQGLVENGNEVEARRQAIECRVRSPGMELPPDSRDYPPYVREYLIEAREALAQARTAPLLVSSEPSGCSVFINGRRLGATGDAAHPYYRQENPARRPHLIQVECGEGNPGRVHTITPGDETPLLVVNTVFEAAVTTDGGILRLRYADNEDPHTRSHVRLMLQALDAQHGIIVSRPHPDRLALTRYGAGPSTTVFVRETFTPSEVADAVTSLFREDDASAPSPPIARVSAADTGEAGLLPPDDTRREASTSNYNWPRIIGVTGTAAGTGAIIGGWLLFGNRRDDGATYRSTLPNDPTYVTNAQTWIDARPRSYFLTAAGSGILAAGLTTLAFSLRRERYPWWVYASTAAVGTGLAAWGGISIAQGGACDAATAEDRRYCVLEQERRDRGAMLMLNAFPLLLAPTIHALFSSSKLEHALSITPVVGRTSALLNLRLAL